MKQGGVVSALRGSARVAWTFATGTALREPTPPLEWPRGNPGQGARVGWEGVEETGLENVRDDNYALQVIARLQLNGPTDLACPSTRSLDIARNASFCHKIMAFKKRHA